METQANRIPGVRGRAESRCLGVLRALALIAVLLGAAGSVGSVLWAGRQQESRLLLLLFCLWVLSPFMALLLADFISRRWSVVTRATLQGVTLAFSLVTLALYANVALGPPKGRSAFLFIVVPPASWLLLATVVPVVALLFGILFRASLDRRLCKDFSILSLLGVAGVGTLLGSLWLEHRSRIELPTPTGQFAVGRAIYDWTDDPHPDAPAPIRANKREVLAWIWYPAVSPKSAAADDYIPAQLRARQPSTGSTLGSMILDLLTRDLSKVHSHSIANPDVSTQERAYPVVMMRTGASLGVLSYSTLAEDLASHGYIVVGFDAPGRTARVVFPGGRVIARTAENNPELYEGQPNDERLGKLLTAWTDDMKFVLDRLGRLNTSDSSGKFTGRLDLTRLGVFGHSFGGAQALQFCSQESRCKAGIDVDGRPIGPVVQSGLRRPFMFLLSDHDLKDRESRQIEADIQSIYDRLPADGRLRIVIRGANHFTFTDDGALLKSHLVRGILRVFGKLRIGGRRQLAVTSYCVHTFFDAYLKETNVSRLNIPSPLYPEIQIRE